MGHFIRERIDVLSHYPATFSSESGGVVLFCGLIRSTNQGLSVVGMEYDAMLPLAENRIVEALEYVRSTYSVSYVQCFHRLGYVAVGEVAILAITAHAHRGSAYAANQWLVDYVKYEVPVWKKEYYSDGSFLWLDQ